MTQQRQVNKPIKINQDKDPKYLGQDEARYMLNVERNIGGGTKSVSGKKTPFPANELICITEVEEGTPYSIGSFKSDLTNEVYSFYYNDGGIHYILRVNEDKSCEIVYQGECLSFSADPKHAIEDWRVYLKYDKFCAHQGGKQLIWTDGLNPIGMIDVEASIATNNFTSYFFNYCNTPCAAIQMCVPEICGAPVGEFMPLEGDQIDLNNAVIDEGIQIAIQHVYYDQRASEWSDISSLLFLDAKGCFDTEEGLPRCIKFRIPIGNPLVDKIRVAKRSNNSPNWVLVDTVEKYEEYTSEGQQWYERELADLLNYSDDDCSFDYIFCNDKGCEPIDPNQFSRRIFNPIPREAQGLIRIKDGLGFYNYVKGNCPLLESETKKFEISLDCEDVANCVQEYETVTFYAIVHQFVDNLNQPVYRMGGELLDTDDDIADTAFFGGIMTQFIGSSPTPEAKYDQFFRSKTRNFIAYIDGTDYWVEMEQWKASANFLNTEKTGILSGMDIGGNSLSFEGQRLNGQFYFQKGEFRVPKGMKGFIRLVSHKKTTGIGSAQDTSTFVNGTIPTLTTYSGTSNITSSVNKKAHEVYFDTCAGSVEVAETFVIMDGDIDNTTGNHSSSSYGGYVKDANNAPVPGAEIWQDGGLFSTTDHNGFYHFYNYEGHNTPISVEVRVEQSSSGAFVNVQTVILANNYNYSERDIAIDTAGYLVNYYEDVSIPVKDCDGNPVGGIRVSLTGNKSALSDAITGIANFKVRNYSSRNRIVRGVVMNNNGCFTLDCEGVCNPCMPSTALTALSSSFEGVPYINIALATDLNLLSATINKKGLKAGGRYPFGLVAQGNCGRISAVYPITVMSGSVTAEDSFLNVPKTQEKGTLSFCNINYDATGLVLPEWTTCVKIVRGLNLNNYELQWIVDKIERLSDGKIRLTVQSLNDYNALYNFNTNTNYQYLEGDRVEFITNGDGSIFDTSTFGLLNYLILSPYHDMVLSGEENAPAEFFNQILIQDDGSLDGLTEGAKIELQRPKDCTVENSAFFEIAVALEVIEVSGQMILAEPTGSFETFDTYLVQRQIGRNASQPFEHRNPSDFWGDKLLGISDIGKPHFVNKFENEKRWGRNITINNVGQFNRFGDFEKTLNAAEHGDITSMGIYDGQIVIAIGEKDNGMFSVADDFVRIANDGTIRASSPDEIISDTQPKVQGQFGCQYEHIGSVFYGDGFVTWADVAKGAYVKHDFNVAKDIAEGQMNSYFRQKWAIMQAFNGTSLSDVERYRFITGFNYFTNALQLTMKPLNGEGINNQKDFLLQDNETILIEPRTEEFLTAASYTPEGYSNLNVNDANGCAFICFRGNSIYLHPIKSTVYNRFFGEAVDMVATIAVNDNPDIIKRVVALEIQDSLMWFVSKVLVDRTSFESEIPPIKMTKQEDKWVGSFLSDKNSKGGLYATDSVASKPRGYFILATLVRDNTDALKVNTTNDAKRILFSTLDMILFKYFYSAQSGFVQNL